MINNLLVMLITVAAFTEAQNITNPLEQVFAIDHENNTFLMDGKPFRYVSGSFHYFRTIPSKWSSIMLNMKAGGLNAVDIYIHWALHNPQDNVFNWEGIADLDRVIETAKQVGLYVILRPGPYICAELDNGGHPYWLYTKYNNIEVRTRDMKYINEVSRWWSKLMTRMQKYLYGNGGPIIMVQVENEYGAFKKCDSVYKRWLAAETNKYVKDKAVLFTVDRPFDGELECGYIDGVFATTDFGLENDSTVDNYWAELRKVQPTGPLVNSEFYTGWLTHWHEQNQRRPAEPLAKTLKKMLADGANVNFYMYFGGTNFGFTAGANDWGIGKYMADITSYDYDAPLDEAGQITNKFFIFKEVVQEAFPDAVFPLPLPPNEVLTDLPVLKLTPRANILSPELKLALNLRVKLFDEPPSFESFDQDSGFLLYETKLPRLTRDPSQLTINGLADRAWVYVDNQLAGILSREHNINTLPIGAGWGHDLQILVENQGRINFQVERDFKGILEGVTLQTYDGNITLTNWTVTGYPFNDYSLIDQVAFNPDRVVSLDNKGLLLNGPVIFSTQFDLPFPVEQRIYPDLYLDFVDWGKGIIFVNGWNLGRYWPLAGPQVSTYVPGHILKLKQNKVVLVEFQKYNKDEYKLPFLEGPRLDG